MVERHPGTSIHPRAAGSSSARSRRTGAPASRRRCSRRPGRVPPERRDHVGQVARRRGARVVLPLDQRRRRAAEPVATPLHHADRARAGAEGARGRARRAALVRREVTGLETGTTARPRSSSTARPGKERTVTRSISWPPTGRAARCDAARRRDGRARHVLRQHHHLLQGRHARAARRPNLSVIYVVNPRVQGFFRFSIDGQSGFLVVNTAVDETASASRRLRATPTRSACGRSARRSARRTWRSRSRTCSGGTRAPNGRERLRAGGCSSPATPRT